MAIYSLVETGERDKNGIVMHYVTKDGRAIAKNVNYDKGRKKIAKVMKPGDTYREIAVKKQVGQYDKSILSCNLSYEEWLIDEKAA